MENSSIYAFLHENYEGIKQKAGERGFKKYLTEKIRAQRLDAYLARKRQLVKSISELIFAEDIGKEDIGLLNDEHTRIMITSMPYGATNEIPFYYSIWLRYGHEHGIAEASTREKAKSLPGYFLINANMIKLTEKGLKLASLIKNIEKAKERGFWGVF